MRPEPVNLTKILATFDETWSPRIIAQINEYDIRIAHVEGEHVWHVHEETDEFFLVLKGEFNILMRLGDREESVTLLEGDTYVVPKGIYHKPFSKEASILMFEPTGTSSTGDHYVGSLPKNIKNTTGYLLSRD